MIVVLLAFLIALAVLLRDSELGHALASRIERRPPGAGGDVLAERVAYLEGEIDRLNAEVRRLDDEGQFLHRLLLEKAETGPLPRVEPTD